MSQLLQRSVWYARTAVTLMLVSVAGCAGLPSATQDSDSDRPVFDRPPVTQAEGRAKISVELGMAYLGIGRFDVALDEARTALAHDSGYAPAYHLMGLVYTYLEDTPAARENFRKALSIAPRDPDINNSYGWFQCVQGETQDGLARLGAAARNPYYRFPARAYTNAGLCHLRLNDESAALEQFQRATQLEPGNLQAQYQIAAISYRQGNYRLASQRLTELHQRREPTAESVWLALRVERRLGNRQAEASYAEQLRGRFGESPEYQSMMQGNFE